MIGRVIKLNNEIVFIDFFDTLVNRKIYPDKTKYLWAVKLVDSLNNIVKYSTILQFRITAENLLTKNNYSLSYF